MHTHDITEYKTCPRMYNYRAIEGLQPKVESPKLRIGTGFHLAVGAYYRSGGNAHHALAICELWAEGNPDAAEASAVRRLVEHYIEFAKANDTFQVCAVEQCFRVPVWTPSGRRSPGVVFCGTFDGVIRDHRGRLALLEHKTARDFPPDVTLALDEQAGFYLLAANQLFGEVVDTVLYNVVRKVDPQRAKKEMVRRYYVVRNNHELRRLRDRLYYAYLQLKRDKLFLPSPGFHCGWKCPYTQLCTAEEAGFDVQYLKQEFYEPVGRQPSWVDQLDKLELRLARRTVFACATEDGRRIALG